MMQKEGASISEDDVAVILQRYSPTTILALLQEVAQLEDVKIDWNALVKHTKTGITNPREYQMLWRHLAYSDPLLAKLENDDVEPLDDDSDLECDLEAFPTVSNEASAEAAACVKVLMGSGSPSNSCIEKGLTIEAPLTINIPRTKSTQYPSQYPQFTSGVNITVPVLVPTQAFPAVSSAEGLDNTNGPAHGLSNNNLPAKRKRKPWSTEEDRELFDAVQRFGEGNWAHMLKGDFKSDRTASQLSQRWNIIKKRQSNSIMKTGSQLSEVQLAARHAINMALDKPGVDNQKTPLPLGRSNPTVQPTVADPPSSTTLPQQDSVPTWPKTPFPRPQPFTNRPLTTGSDAVKAAAVAAGARIATQSAAAEILKQQQLKGAIHIKTTRPPHGPGHGPGVAHMGPRPNAPWPNLGSSHANMNEVKPSGLVNSPEPPIQEDQVVHDNGSKDQDPTNMKVES